MGLLEFIPVIGKLLDRVLPDKAAAEAAKLKVLELAQSGQLAELDAETKLAQGQMEINKTEAASASLFVSGWRPAIGWVCAGIFAANYIGVPLLAWVSPSMGWAAPPRLDIGEVLPVMLGMLGLGGLRTAEKIKGIVK